MTIKGFAGGLLVPLLLLLMLGCEEKPADYKKIPAFSKDGFIQAVIEIPAGTNHKYEYDPKTNTFPCDSVNGRPRIINFAGYPGNYGFIPSTWMDPEKGGDGDALDILVISESVPTGTVMEVIPLGLMQLIDGGEKDYKVIAVPALSSQRSLRATNREEMSSELTYMIELWFLNYKGTGKTELIGWKDEKEVREIIDKWVINP